MASCNRCQATITFHKSERTGRWYPCNSQDRRDFHKCAATPGPLFPVAAVAPVAAPVVLSLTEAQEAAKTWILAYTGSFEFLLSMQDRVNRDLRMSDRQWAAITRSMSRGRGRSHGRSVRGGAAKTQEDLVTASFGRGGTLEEVDISGDPWA
jgi:hypothetical protein